MYNKLIWNIFINLDTYFKSTSRDTGIHLLNINNTQMINLLNKETLNLFIHSNTLQSVFNAIKSVGNFYDYHSIDNVIIQCVQKVLDLVNNEQFIQYERIEIVVQMFYIHYKSMWYTQEDEMYTHFSNVIEVILRIIHSNNHNTINNLCLLLQNIEFLEELKCDRFHVINNHDDIKLKVNNICNVYEDSLKRYYYQKIKLKNNLLCHGYIKHNINQFTKDLQYIIIKYLGDNNNRLHIMQNAIINYKKKQYHIININDTLISIKHNNDTDTIKHGMTQRMYINPQNIKNIQLAQPIAGKYKGKLCQVLDIWRDRFVYVKIYRDTGIEKRIIVLDFLCPIKYTTYKPQQDELLSVEYTAEMTFIQKQMYNVSASMIQKIKKLSGIPSLYRFLGMDEKGTRLNCDYYSCGMRLDMPKDISIKSIIESLYSKKMNKEQQENAKNVSWIFCEVVPYSMYTMDEFKRFCSEYNERPFNRVFKFGYNCDDWCVHFLLSHRVGQEQKEEIKKYFGISMPEQKLSAIIFWRK